MLFFTQKKLFSILPLKKKLPYNITRSVGLILVKDGGAGRSGGQRFNLGECMSPVIQVTVYIRAVYCLFSKGRLSYHLSVESFSQLLYDSEMYTKSAAVSDFVYISESNEIWGKYSTQR